MIIAKRKWHTTCWPINWFSPVAIRFAQDILFRCYSCYSNQVSIFSTLECKQLIYQPYALFGKCHWNHMYINHYLHLNIRRLYEQMRKKKNEYVSHTRMRCIDQKAIIEGNQFIGKWFQNQAATLAANHGRAEKCLIVFSHANNLISDFVMDVWYVMLMHNANYMHIVHCSWISWHVIKNQVHTCPLA